MSSKRSEKTLRAAPAAALILAGALLSGCSNEHARSALTPGALVQDAPFQLAGASAALGAKADARFIRFGSTSAARDETVEVSARVLIPHAAPPPGGYPLVSYGHGAVGFDPACGPTATKDLGPDDAPRVGALLDSGYVVAVPDYQGLGAGAEHQGSGGHPFREPKTLGHNMIDAAHAAKALLDKLGIAASGAWAAYGESQGGEAAWAAGDLAASAGGAGLRLVGVAAEKPPTDFTWLVDGAAAGVLSQGEQISYLRLLRGLQVVRPELALDQYVRGPLADKANQDVLFRCFAQSGDEVVAIARRLRPNDTALSPQQARQLTAWLADWRLPLPETAPSGAEPAPVPFFVAASAQDEVVPISSVRRAASEEEARRSAPMRLVVQDGGLHHEFDDSAEAIAWIGDRFAGRR
ncbi:secretory lipase [Segniliparus rotundus DSM 44985]|uniref:Secretory lipase n=1 Tax=Segniliparus rotundus (strain ATCC BAA-972 / CDC 1076 / CIP 108378 / DSM 44985 / JCM 13578) TaxID=640132 RepID=D6Z8M1_SEGRD|nr:lipase family protein [Segniliparus rotundus]ADG98301.1 secretory lipase [Segniliparus rotundus DSM 44985]